MSKVVFETRPKITKADALKELSAYPELAHFPVVVLGIRGYYKKGMGDPLKNDRGIFDDAIMIIAPDHYSAYNGNTDPSVARPGIACVVAPQVVMYKPGIHGISGKNPRPAFRQFGRVKVTRDGKEGIFTDSAAAPFFCNIHDGGLFSTSSEGCQTIYKLQWAEFRDRLNEQLKLNGQESFPYLLIEYK